MKELQDELRPENLASYWYNRYCTLVTESIPPTAEKAYLIERIKVAEDRVKALEKENENLKNIIEQFKFRTL
jgi:hypothetical protein